MPDPVLFDAVGALGDDGYVLRSGKIFQAGEYKDKNYSMTPEELASAVEAFTVCPVDLEHTETILSGKLGEVRSVALSDDGASLMGTVALPRWLDDAIGDTERKVSATWDRATKTLQGLALVLDPRVPDAALMSAYAAFAAKRHDTPHGQMAMQELHDTSVRHGAVCSQANAKMASRHESSAIQSVHDTAVSHGATCQAMGAKQTAGYPMFGAGDPAPTTAAPKKEGKKMGNFEKFMQWITAENGAAEAVTEGQAVAGAAVMGAGAATQPKPADDEKVRLAADNAAQRAEIQRLRAASIQRDAVIFADEQIRDGRALPCERDAIIDAFTQASIDDSGLGAVQFSDGRATSRVEIVKRQYKDRQSVKKLFEEYVGDDVLMALHQRATPKKDGEAPDADETARLIGLTSFGQAHLNGAAKN